MLYKEKPENFTPKFEVVSCFVEYNNKILLLLRQDHKPEPNTYGVPAGKVDIWETIQEAIQREVWEETGIELKDAKHFEKLYVKYPDFDFTYHIFHQKIDQKPNVTINLNEHKEYKRIHPKKALELDLIEDEDACIKLFYKVK